MSKSNPAPATSPKPAGRRRWLIIALLFFATTVNYVDRTMLGLLAPSLGKELGWSEDDYGNIVTAVTAVKLGAFDYLAKPADADEIYGALMATRDTRPEVPENPMSADRVRWEHIQRVYEMCDRNVSETARRLSMHRRTLQRILAKRSPK